jgi:hypothetical protein
MFIEENEYEIEKLYELSNDSDPKIAFLAHYIRKIILAADLEDSHRRESMEREG